MGQTVNVNGEPPVPYERSAPVREDGRRPAQVVVRDRKVARECALCIGMSAAVMAVAAMVDTRTDSPRTDRSHHTSTGPRLLERLK